MPPTGSESRPKDHGAHFLQCSFSTKFITWNASLFGRKPREHDVQGFLCHHQCMLQICVGICYGRRDRLYEGSKKWKRGLEEVECWKSELQRVRAADRITHLGRFFTKGFSGSWDPSATERFSVLVHKWSAASPKLTFLFDLSALLHFSLFLVASHRSYKHLWSPLLQAQEQSLQLHFISDNVCLLHAYGVKGFVLGPERKAWASPSVCGAQAPRVGACLHVHTEVGAAGLWVMKSAHQVKKSLLEDASYNLGTSWLWMYSNMIFQTWRREKFTSVGMAVDSLSGFSLPSCSSSRWDAFQS